MLHFVLKVDTATFTKQNLLQKTEQINSMDEKKTWNCNSYTTAVLHINRL